MMNKRNLLIVASALILGATLPAQAMTPVQVTSNNTQDTQAQIAGDHIVWQGKTDNHWEIYHYHIGTGLTTRITNNTSNDITPFTDGHYITWIGNEGNGDVLYYDLANATTATVTELAGTVGNMHPQVAAGRIAWSASGKVYLHDINSTTTTDITADIDPNGLMQHALRRLTANTLIWSQLDDQGTTDPDDDIETMQIYDIATGSITAAAETFWPSQYRRDGLLSVVSRDDGNDREIYLTNRRSGKLQITDNTVPDTTPGISGNTIVWVSGAGDAAEIYVATDLDSDSDGITDSFDNCVDTANSNQLDSNNNGIGDACEVSDGPAVQIFANGSEAPITITTADSLNLAISLSANSNANQAADWSVLAETPFGWYHFSATSGSWATGQNVSYQNNLFDITQYPIGVPSLPAGAYTFYFGVDLNQDGNVENLNNAATVAVTVETAL